MMGLRGLLWSRRRLSSGSIPRTIDNQILSLAGRRGGKGGKWECLKPIGFYSGEITLTNSLTYQLLL